MIAILEEARWQYHMQHVLPAARGNFNSIMHPAIWWHEQGIYVSTLPRQSGKTTLIKKLMDESNDQCRLVVATPHMVLLLNKKGIEACTTQYLAGIPNSNLDILNTNIFVDEYQLMSESAMDYICSYNWKSISLFGTFRGTHG